jgi:hypothetical protein
MVVQCPTVALKLRNKGNHLRQKHKLTQKQLTLPKNSKIMLIVIRCRSMKEGNFLSI